MRTIAAIVGFWVPIVLMGCAENSPSGSDPVDTTPPSVELSVDGLSYSVTASDDIAVEVIEHRVDSEGDGFSNNSWEQYTESETLSSPASVQARATDTSGIVSDVVEKFVGTGGPSVSLEYNNGKIEITGSDDTSITKVTLNGSEVTAQDTDNSTEGFFASLDAVAGQYNTVEVFDDINQKAEAQIYAPFTSVTASLGLSSTSVQHNHDSAAEVTGSVSVTDGGYDHADWYLDGSLIGSSDFSDSFGVDVTYVGTKTLEAKLYNSNDDLLDTLSDSIEGLNTAPNVPTIYEWDGSAWTEPSSISVFQGIPLIYRVELSDDNNDPLELLRNISSWGTSQTTTDYNVPNEGDVYIGQDPDSDGSTNLFEVRMNTLNRQRGPPYTFGDKAGETGETSLPGTSAETDIYVQ